MIHEHRVAVPNIGRVGMVLAMALCPFVAEACPYCIGRGQGHGALFILALLVVFPYGVAFVVLRAIRRFSASPGDGQEQSHVRAP
jgi:hypothetical protein